ncbi:MAG: hypothetical protein M4579_005065 [Chaenotheca gracillima]|nr:MAG: hypothetical protein M4579_005065 [Chaenotheca gracillima]
MGLLEAGELLQFPSGNNATDVLINGIHFNKTALDYFNYTLWSNNTLSNGSNCFLSFAQYQPILLNNGTILNGTSCYDPIQGIHERGILGLVFGSLFGLSLMFTLVNLRKHGRLFVPQEKRFRAVGRRWQWYWMLFVGAAGMISGLVGIDVDRAYLQSISIVLQNFFFFLMTPTILAAVWEGVRHWGSWQERQIYDREPFLIPPDDIRGKKEFYMPLVFYFFGFMNFFMTIPRSWTKIEDQRDINQQNRLAKPVGIDGRFKAGSIFAFLGWCVICYSLRHSIYYYKPRNRGLWRRFNGFLHFAPTKFMLIIPVALIVVGYDIAIAFDWNISPLKYDANSGWIYGLGYAPVFLVVLIFEIWGYIDENEDQIILEQRRLRGRAADQELGIVKKPGWWSKRHGEMPMDNEARLRALTTEIGGGPATQRNIEQSLELGNMPSRRPPAAEVFSDNPERYKDTFEVGEESRRKARRSDSSTTTRSNQSTPSTTTNAQPTRIRSMLDI